MIGYSSGHHRQGRPEVIRRAAAEAFALVMAGQVNVHIGNTFPMEDAPQAHPLVEKSAVVGRMLLTT